MRLPPARATAAIIGATAGAWGIAALAGLSPQLAVLAGFIPGRLSLGFTPPQAVPFWATPLTATLVHAGLLHLLFNMLMLGFCARFVEASIGAGGVVLLYLVGAYAAAAAQYVADPQGLVPMVGASGAASAVIGAYALLYGRPRAMGWSPRSGRALHVAWLAAAWIGLQALIGFAQGGMPGVPEGSSIAVAAHIGGFLAGLVLARPLLLFRYRSA
ncbi:rhomboid family intramembrane serine protease [Sphingomonas morindae]|uniref:Rhomboid family intramembrane serine protease n=1 Tax=Sphingomonas morindae TaxID=1541170 RepID=A0ABY4X7Z9_9SPHN|nr:rhomboid family intramembrane serine protease [Sphingomonas morindae]USI73037.1 rhomboid family intramembrane serine protease [Sphingomonas morindae]